MAQDHDTSAKRQGQSTLTRLVHCGRDAEEQFGFVNPPIVRGSTVLFPDVASLTSGDARYTYGRHGSPTVRLLEEAIAELEGGALTRLAPSGLAAISAALLAFVEAGDHILVTDSVYRPTRRFCDRVLSRLGVETEYYDPLIGEGIAALMRDNTRAVFTESPGSHSFEMQDIPAIAAAAHARGAWVLTDNTWATPLYFKPFDHGVDVSIQAATKYIVGHSDAMLGAMTANDGAANRIEACSHRCWGFAPARKTCWLGLRGSADHGVRLSVTRLQGWRSRAGCPSGPRLRACCTRRCRRPWPRHLAARLYRRFRAVHGDPAPGVA